MSSRELEDKQEESPLCIVKRTRVRRLAVYYSASTIAQSSELAGTPDSDESQRKVVPTRRDQRDSGYTEADMCMLRQDETDKHCTLAENSAKDAARTFPGTECHEYGLVCWLPVGFDWHVDD